MFVTRTLTVGALLAVLALNFSDIAKPVSGAEQTDSKTGITFVTRRHAYQRGELAKIEVNVTEATSDAASAQFAVGNLLTAAVPLAEGRATWSLDTRLLKAGEYEVTCEAKGQKAAFRLVIAKEPNPQRFPFFLWGGSNGLKLAAQAAGASGSSPPAPHGGFTCCMHGAIRDPVQAGTTADETLRQSLEQAVESGYDMALYLYPALSKRFEGDSWMGIAPNGKIWSHRRVELARPEVGDYCDAVGRSMVPYCEYPSLTMCMLQSEFEAYVSYSELYRRRTREALGIDLATIPPTLKAPDEAVPDSGVVADDHPLRRFYFWWWKEGDGLTEANARIAAPLKAAKPSILTWHEPYRRAPVLGVYRGLDMIGTWTYTFPDPKYIAYVEVLKAAARPARQKVFQNITLWEYAGWLAPKEEGHLTMPGDITRECLWLAFSHRPDALGSYLSSLHSKQLSELLGAGKRESLSVSVAPFIAIREFRETVGEPFGPTLLALSDMPRRVAVLNLATPVIFRKTKDIPRSNYACEQVRDWYALLMMAHIPADVLLEEQVEQGALAAYDLAVLPFAETISQSTFNRLNEFIKRGGRLVVDRYSRANLPGIQRLDFDFSHRKRMTADGVSQAGAAADDNAGTGTGVSADADRAIMNRYAPQLREALKDRIRPYADCDSPEALLNVLERGDTRYLFVVNDRREYGPRFGKWRTLHEKGVAQTVTLMLREPRNVRLFDVLTHTEVPTVRKGDSLSLSLDLPSAGGRIVAIMTSPPSQVEVSLPKSAKRGELVEVSVALRDAKGELPRGAHPLRITITDAQGHENEYSRYGCALDGRFAMKFIPALNEPAGLWQVGVTESCTGKQAKQSVETQ
jgi:hypothetical protein